MVRAKSRFVIAGAAFVLLSLNFVFAQHQHPMSGDVPRTEDMLMPGAYTAKVKAIVCEGCATLIQKTLQGINEVEAVSVDQKSRTVRFSVKKDKMTSVNVLQKSLKAASKRMGMGADYTLSDVRAR